MLESAKTLASISESMKTLSAVDSINAWSELPCGVVRVASRSAVELLAHVHLTRRGAIARAGIG